MASVRAVAVPRFTRRVLLPVLSLASLALVACGESGHGEGEEAEFRLVASHPLKKDVVVTSEYVCQVQASQHIDVRALERGYIERISVREGDQVKAGQLLMAVQPRVYEAELQRASAEVAAARVEYENTKSLAEGRVVAPAELALAEARFMRAEGEEKLAKAHLAFTEIRAPFDGLMDRLQVREGSLVDEGELLTTLSDTRQLWVYFNVPEGEYLDFVKRPASERQRPVRLRMANGEFFDQTGRIAVIEADFNSETGTIPFRADFPNPRGLLRHGQTCNIVLQAPISNAVLIPQKSTFEVLDHIYAYVIDAGGVVRQRLIEVREGLEDLFIVQRGLAEGDIVLIEGLRQVREGQKVEYTLLPTDSAFANLKLHAE